MKKIFILLFALLISASAFGQTYPSPKFAGVTVTTSFSAPGLVHTTDLAAQAANTVLANVTGSSASPTAFSLTNCSTSSSAMTYTTGTGFTCNSTINAATLGGATFASPGAIGSTTPGSGAFTALSASSIGSTSPGSGAFTTLSASTTNPGFTFTASGAGGSARTYASKMGDIVNVKDYGALCNGSTDDTVADTNALAVFGPNGGTLQFPPGTCVYSSLTIPANVVLAGMGSSSTTLATNSATANGLTFNGTGGGIKNVQLASTVTRTAGAYVSSAYGITVNNVAVTGHFVGFSIAGASPSALAVNPSFTNVNMFLPATGAGSAAMIFENYANAVVKGSVVTGTPSGQQPDYGLVFRNGDTAFVSDTNVTRNGYALAIIPGAGENNYSFNASNSDFDSAGLISGSVNASSCLIQPTSNGNVYESHFTNVWCGLALGDGALIGSSGTGVIDGMHWSGGIFDGNGGSGFHITSNVQNWSAVGGHAAGNTGSGYYVSAASNDWNLLGVRAGPVSNRGSNGAAGVNVGVNASNNYTIIADTSGNTGGTISNSGTGAVQTVINNGALAVTQAIKPSSTSGITGTSTNDDANAGAVGEYPTPTNLTSVSLTSGTAANGASVPLTAGDWDVSGTCQFIPAGSTTISSVIAGINTVSATLPGAPNETAIQSALTTGAQQIISAGPARIKLAGNTTVYLVCQSGFGASTMTVNGFIRARRPR